MENEFNMFYTDKPINTSDEDILDRKSFAEQLAKAILSYNKQDNLIIGISGKWGSGKTSVINMALNYIATQEQTDDAPIIIKFNPWNYSNSEQLISQFFHSIIIDLENEDKELKSKNKKNNMLESVGEALRTYSSLLEYTVFIPVIGPYTIPLKELAKDTSNSISNKYANSPTVEKQKEEVEDSLKKINKKIIIVIDDIDRLNNEQIRLIFRLVNSLAGFSNMIYLLSYDKDVVVRALEKEQQYKGEEYLEKIIQANFEIPMYDGEAIYDYLKEKINPFLKQEKEYDDQYFNTVYRNCVIPFVDSIRDVNRILNVFMFKYELIKEEINCIDLLAITTFQVCEHSIFNWIVKNTAVLYGDIYDGQFKETDKEKEKNAYLKDFDNIYPKSPKDMLNAIQTLFPKFSYTTGGDYSDSTIFELRQKKRIACKDKAKFYFSLSLNDVAISKRTIEDTIYNYNQDELHNYLFSILETKKIYYYIMEIRGYSKHIHKCNKTSWFFDEFINLQIEIKKNKDNIKHSSSLLAECQEFCFDILRSIGSSNNIFNFLSFRIDNADVRKMSLYVNMIKLMKRAQQDSNLKKYQFLDSEKFIAFESDVSKKLKELYNSENIFCSDNYEDILSLCIELDKEYFTDVIIESLENPINTIKYLKTISGLWENIHGTGWYFEEKNFEYISVHKAIKQVNSVIDEPEKFNSLSIELKEIAIAYQMWFKRRFKLKNIIDSKISKKEVDDKLSKISPQS